MARGAATRRYAKALFALAQEEGRVDGVRQELERMQGLLEEHVELHDVLFQPLHPSEQRRAVLMGVAERLASSPLLRHFYEFLIDRRRLVDLDAIAREYDRLADAEAGVTQARVRSAAPLREEQLARLRAALSTHVGRDVSLEVEVDPELIGGVVAQVGDLVFDGSLRTQLAQLRASLVRE